jgi:hypothetical protein
MLPGHLPILHKDRCEQEELSCANHMLLYVLTLLRCRASGLANYVGSILFTLPVERIFVRY